MKSQTSSAQPSQLKSPASIDNVIDWQSRYNQKQKKLTDYSEAYELLKHLEKNPHLRELAILMLQDEDNEE